MGDYEADAPRASVPTDSARENMRTSLLTRVVGAAIEWANATMILSMAQASHAETPDEEKEAATRIAEAEEDVCDAEVALFTMLCGDDGYPVKDFDALQIRALARPDARASGASAQESKDFPP